jgi:hypothetical protein
MKKHATPANKIITKMIPTIGGRAPAEIFRAGKRSRKNDFLVNRKLSTTVPDMRPEPYEGHSK